MTATRETSHVAETESTTPPRSDTGRLAPGAGGGVILDKEQPMNKYRVRLESKPSFWEFYKGYVDVYAENDEAAERAAIRKLATGIFQDRGFNAWIVISVTRYC